MLFFFFVFFFFSITTTSFPRLHNIPRGDVLATSERRSWDIISLLGALEKINKKHTLL